VVALEKYFIEYTNNVEAEEESDLNKNFHKTFNALFKY
jgi:hypothetical protein